MISERDLKAGVSGLVTAQSVKDPFMPFNGYLYRSFPEHELPPKSMKKGVK